MTIKIRLHGDKAIIRWKTPVEKEFMKRQLIMFRDTVKIVTVNLRDERGREIPRMQMIQMRPNIGGGEVISPPPIKPIPATGEVKSPPVDESLVVKLNKPEEKKEPQQIPIAEEKKDVERPA
jgi:hypothetical protein